MAFAIQGCRTVEENYWPPIQLHFKSWQHESINSLHLNCKLYSQGEMQKFTFWWKGFWSRQGRKLILITCHLFFTLVIQPQPAKLPTFCDLHFTITIIKGQRVSSFCQFQITKKIPLSYCLPDRILVLSVRSCAIHHLLKLCSNSSYAHEGQCVERLPFFLPFKVACCDLTSLPSILNLESQLCWYLSTKFFNLHFSFLQKYYEKSSFWKSSFFKEKKWMEYYHFSSRYLCP